MSRLLHVGIVVDKVGGIENGAEILKQFGYVEHFRVRRAEEWIGKIVGIQGADIDIAHYDRPGDPVSIELLAYHSDPRPSPGVQHLAYEVEDMEKWLRERKKIHEGPGGLDLLGEAEIPDGPNKGTRCAYLKGLDGILVELIQKQKTPIQRTIDGIEDLRRRNNSLWMGLVRLSMEKFPEEARAIFDKIEANDREILDLSRWMRKSKGEA